MHFLRDFSNRQNKYQCVELVCMGDAFELGMVGKGLTQGSGQINIVSTAESFSLKSNQLASSSFMKGIQENRQTQCPGRSRLLLLVFT